MEKIFDLTLIQENDMDMGRTCVGKTLVSPTSKGVFSAKRNYSVPGVFRKLWESRKRQIINPPERK